jgi:hypothetical protein
VRRGVAGVLVVACGQGSCTYREGGRWTIDRMSGRRLPALRTDKVDPDRVRVLELFGFERAALVQKAAEFRTGRSAVAARALPRTAHALAALALVGVLAAVIVVPTRIVYGTPVARQPELVVSFRHAGKASQHCHELSAADKARLPVHMRPKKQICERRRADVRLRVAVDGKPLFERAYAPTGIWGDGTSVGLERIAVPPGEHEIVVEVGDTLDRNDWSVRTERRVRFEAGRGEVVVFEAGGFSWK